MSDAVFLDMPPVAPLYQATLASARARHDRASAPTSATMDGERVDGDNESSFSSNSNGNSTANNNSSVAHADRGIVNNRPLSPSTPPLNGDGDDALSVLLPPFDAQSPTLRPLPFRQHLLWSASMLLFAAYLATVLYFFLTSPTFRHFVVHRANALFALPYILSLLVVLVCLAPCSPGPARPQLDAVITSPADCALVLLVLLEWATCLALVLVTLVAVHDRLSYVSADGLIVPADTPTPAHPPPPTPAAGISHDAPIIVLVPFLLMYCLFNCLLHLYNCLEASWRVSNNYTDLD